MHLERNLNPTLSLLYVASGIIMVTAAAIVGLALPGNPGGVNKGLIVAVLAISGVLSILSGSLHH